VINLSVLIPARREEWLQRTIDDVLANARGTVEIVAVLDGEWPLEPLRDDPRVILVKTGQSIGQRAATNLAARLSRGRYLMKLDAHCSVAEGFDVELVRTGDALGHDVTQIPAQKNLHIYSWKCHACQAEQYQGPDRTECPACKVSGQMARVIYWRPRPSTRTTSWVFDTQPKFQYDKLGQRHQRGDICDVMTSLGACFVMRRERFFELGGLDESYGSWGSYGIEVALKSWLSGGRHVVTKKTWFAHFFRVGGIGFPYEISGSQQEAARKRARDIWFNNAWSGQVRPLSWLIDKFAPVPDWHDAAGAETLQRVMNEGLAFVNVSAIADHAEPMRESSFGRLVGSGR
jgi:glycosyltransferase involved in cell wall biosynthesis